MTDEFHTCGRHGGQLWCWGYNGSGQLGDGTQTSRLGPDARRHRRRLGVGDGRPVTTRAGRAPVGQLWCWGYNFHGQLGDGTGSATRRSRSASAARPGGPWPRAAAHVRHPRRHPPLLGTRRRQSATAPTSIAYTRCWPASRPTGRTSPRAVTTRAASAPTSRCGAGATTRTARSATAPRTDRPFPTRIGIYNDWTDISAGSFHTCGIEQNAFLRCWGWNFSGQIGDGTKVDKLVPTDIPGAGFAQWSSISPGHVHTLRHPGRRAVVLGSQLGGPGRRRHDLRPQRCRSGSASTPTGRTSRSARSTRCGIKSGQLWCWGYNFDGEVGDGDEHQPHRADRSERARRVDRRSARPATTRVRSAAGQLWCWGQNLSGELGDGTTNNHNIHGADRFGDRLVVRRRRQRGHLRHPRRRVVSAGVSTPAANSATAPSTAVSYRSRAGTASDWVSVDGGGDAHRRRRATCRSGSSVDVSGA